MNSYTFKARVFNEDGSFADIPYGQFKVDVGPYESVYEKICAMFKEVKIDNYMFMVKEWHE